MKKAITEWSRNNVYLVSLKSTINSIPGYSIPLTLANDEDHWATRAIKNTILPLRQ
jgi:hypothetical protein